MHEAAERYLALVEQELKKIPGIRPGEGARDAREILTDDLRTWAEREGDLDPETLFDRIVERFGPPEEVAAAYRPPAGHAPTAAGYAPGWRMVCSGCGRSTPAARVGFFRIGAWSWFKFVLGFCRGCRGPRFFRLVKDI